MSGVSRGTYALTDFVQLYCYANASPEMWKESGKGQAWSCLLHDETLRPSDR
jgi:hypothetical protein